MMDVGSAAGSLAGGATQCLVPHWIEVMPLVGVY